MAELTRLPDPALVAVRCLPEQVGAAVAALDIAFPPAPGRFARRDDVRVVAMAPDDWMVIAEQGDSVALAQRLERALADADAAVIDVSGNRICYRLSGDAAAAVLARGCALDLERMAEGAAAFTLIARAPALLLVESASSFLLLPRRSFGRYLEQWFAAAAEGCQRA